MRLRGSIAFCVFCLLAACSEKRHELFSGAFMYTFAHNGPSIMLGFVSGGVFHLSGIFTFENVSGDRERAKDVILRGVRRPGAFWAQADCEVRRDEKSAWEPIGKSAVFGWPAKLVVKAEAKAIDLSVRLDLFEPFIGRYEFGRIILTSGDTSEFFLDDLTPKGRDFSSNQVMQPTASPRTAPLSDD